MELDSASLISLSLHSLTFEIFGAQRPGLWLVGESFFVIALWRFCFVLFF